LERLLDQEKFNVVAKFLDLIPPSQLFVSDFSLHSIGVILSRYKKYGLDFEDSYQFTTAQKYDMTIITFDKDFNISGIRKNSPEEIIDKN